MQSQFEKSFMIPFLCIYGSNLRLISPCELFAHVGSDWYMNFPFACFVSRSQRFGRLYHDMNDFMKTYYRRGGYKAAWWSSRNGLIVCFLPAPPTNRNDEICAVTCHRRAVFSSTIS